MKQTVYTASPESHSRFMSGVSILRVTQLVQVVDAPVVPADGGEPE